MMMGKAESEGGSGSAGKCETCQISFNSQSQSEAHLSGSKHKRKLEALVQGKSVGQTTTGVVAKDSEGGTAGSAGKCETCQISFNSQSQAEAHLTGAKHKRKLENLSNSLLTTTTGRPFKKAVRKENRGKNWSSAQGKWNNSKQAGWQGGSSENQTQPWKWGKASRWDNPQPEWEDYDNYQFDNSYSGGYTGGEYSAGYTGGYSGGFGGGDNQFTGAGFTTGGYSGGNESFENTTGYTDYTGDSYDNQTRTPFSRFNRKPKPTGPVTIECEICSVTLNSAQQAKAHYISSKHLKSIGADVKALPEKSPEKPDTTNSWAQVECDFCNTPINSVHQAKQHFTSLRHLKKLGLQSLPITPKTLPVATVSPLTDTMGKKSKDVGTPVTCETCQVTLNSDVQANQHFTGTKHLKKLRLKTDGTSAENPAAGATPASTTGGATDAAGKEGKEGGSKLDPVSQAVYDNIMGKLPTKRKLDIHCSVCDLTINSEVQADQHFKGARHAKRLKVMTELKTLGDEGEGTDGSPVKKDMKFFCPVCNLALNSSQQFEQHQEGEQHRKNVLKKSKPDDPNAPVVVVPASKLIEHQGRESGKYYCRLCDISVTTAAQLHQHMNTEKHHEKVAEERAAGGSGRAVEGMDTAESSQDYSNNSNQQGEPLTTTYSNNGGLSHDPLQDI